ncbi:carboxypeptidase regulatory-like domain-containing protein [Candidatus Micrarchaeota archaeon]|nr:carboxypeptidase regulatory-like domain-containing protein [Candidatus Micrarchaeota archaeon]
MLNVMPAQDSGYPEANLGPDDWITLAENDSQWEKNFTLQRSGFVYGCVLGNNTTALVPLQGASANIFEPTPGGAWGWGQTGENGCFNVSISPGTGYMININSPYNSGYSNYMQNTQNGGDGIDVVSGATTMFGNVTLRLGARIRGYVTNANGTGLQWISVNAHPRMMGPGEGNGGGNDWGFANTNEQGYFEISGLTENNSYDLEAFPDPNSDYSTGSAQAELTSAITEVNITLITGNRVFGTVTCDGSAIPYVPVNVFSSEGMGNGPMMGAMESGRFAFSMTDNNGEYSARGLLAGNYSMRVETPWNQEIDCSNAFESIEVTGALEHNVSMPLASILTGYVLDASDNSTIPYGFVDAFVPSQGQPGEQMMGPSAYAMVNESGGYTLHLTPNNASYIVHVQPPWGTTYAGQEGTVRINASGQTTALNFSLTSGGIISGRVQNSSGSPVQFAFVNAFSENAHSFGFASTSSDGTFSVRGLSAATDFNLFIQPSFTSSTYATVVPTFVESVTVSEGQTTDLGTITASDADSSLSLTITDNGIALANLNVHAWKPFTPFFGYCSTNISGMCDINGLLSGSYDVFIEPSGTRPPVFRSVNVSGSGSYVFDYTSDLGSLYDINGTVSNGTDPIPYADVGIFSESAHFGTHAFADANGFFTLYGVPSGNYTLNADSWGYYHYMEQLEVGANAVHNITLASFNVAESFTVDGYLVSPTSSSVSTKTVVIVDAQNASLFSTFNVTDASGYYTIAGVPASTYMISAAMGNRTYSSNQTNVSASTTINITVS